VSELKPTDRLNYDGDFAGIVDELSSAYDIGEVKSFSSIEIGYEDCNVAIEADTGKYVAKMFAKTRTSEDIERYVTIMQKVVEAGVNHPELLSTKQNNRVFAAGGLSSVLMRFVEGKTFYELDRAPDDSERLAVLEQAKKVNAIEYHPAYLFDSWAIPNISVMLEKVRQFVAPEDLQLAEQAVERYEAIPVETLPHAFVHGDFTKANIMKGDDGEIYVFDFSVANWYPRIQELAVIVANLLHDNTSERSILEICNLVADEYGLLTDEERKHLPTYTLAGVAMEFLGAHQEKYINGIDNEENDYWMSLGRAGLQKELGQN
jgi:Ser/Thr protein kinase RdoA (MazF antagonist)